jgi:hypothetical protein
MRRLNPRATEQGINSRLIRENRELISGFSTGQGISLKIDPLAATKCLFPAVAEGDAVC